MIEKAGGKGDHCMRQMKRTLLWILAVLLFPVWIYAAEDSVFIRIDRDDPNAWKKELDNVRFLEEERMSGSAQFSETQFHDLAAELKKHSEEIWVVDCRLESHGLINGIAVSWYGGNNEANLGKTAEAVEAEEEALSDLTGTTVTAYTVGENQPKDGRELVVEKWETERALVEAEGIHYLRLACPDHCWPPSEMIDSFIDFAKNLEEDTWLHFHCQAGSGRTGAFMTIYEMMQKPDVPVEDILRHQAETGSGNLAERAKPEKSHAQKERCVLVRAVYQYIRANKDSGYEMKWSDWLEAHSRTITMHVGEKLDGEGFSSDQLVVTDSLEAIAPGQATVLVDDVVCFITVHGQDKTAEESTEGDHDKMRLEAVYLGVNNYGSEEVNKDTMEDFRYRFLIDGKETDFVFGSPTAEATKSSSEDIESTTKTSFWEEVLFRIDSGEPDENGQYEYPIQNRLKENYRYEIIVDDDTVTSVEEILEGEPVDFEPVVSGIPGKKTLGNFLKTAMEPVGTTLYIYGGGWDWQDMGSSLQSKTIGVSPDWVRFFREQDENYTYKSKDGDESNSDPSTSYYPYGGYNEYYYAGLDCSGYLGWALNNTLETESGEGGYVVFARRYAKMLSEMELGDFTRDVKAPVYDQGYEVKPGDIMSTKGHVWLSLGTCGDGSVVILHSTPADSRTGQPGGGVELSAVGLSEECEAYQLADRYMSEYYPEWYERYPIKLADPDTYFSFTNEEAGRFTWDTDQGELQDPEGVRDMTPAQVLAFLFKE